MPSDAMQRIKQLERSANTLARDLALLRNQRSSAVGAIEPVIVKTIGAIAAKTVDGTGFDVTYADAELWDISRVTTGSADLVGVVDGSAVKRTIKLGNPYESPLPATTFLMAVPYKGNYLAVSTQLGVELYRFTLNANLSTGTADADILEMDGTDTTIDANVLDPLGIFSTLVNGDAGLCLKYLGVYYVIQAPCPA